MRVSKALSLMSGVMMAVGGLLLASPLSPAQAVTNVFFEDFEGCTTTGTPYNGGNEPTAIHSGNPIYVDVYVNGTPTCSGWTMSGPPWLAIEHGGHNQFPSGDKAMWLNEEGQSISRTFSGLVAGEAYSVSVKTWTDNEDAATSLQIALTGGTTNTMFMPMAAGTGIQAVTTEFCSGGTDVTVTANQGGYSAASPIIDDFSIDNLGTPCSDFFALSIPDSAIVGSVGSPITPTGEPTTTGLRGDVTFDVAGLPSGLVVDPATGVISGTPLAAQPSTDYEMTATGSDSGVASATVNITVTEGTLSPSTVQVDARQGSPITPTVPFTASGLSGNITYSISPNLPDGLVFDPATGVISGTPRNQQGPITYTITATDGTHTASATVTITVGPPDATAGLGLVDTGLPLRLGIIVASTGLTLLGLAWFMLNARRRLGWLGVDLSVRDKFSEVWARLDRMEASRRRHKARTSRTRAH